MISAAIIGGSGYTGKYLIKFCNEHPNISEYVVYANLSANKEVYTVFPELVGEVNNNIIKSITNIDLSHDVYFFALPHGESLNYIPALADKNKKIIDLGADFRLDNNETFLNTYQLEHSASRYLTKKHYGLAEQNPNYEYTLIANPGCYPTAALLSSIPVVKNYSGNIQSISTVAYSGLSGAGKSVLPGLMFSENYNNVKAYNVGVHRHEVEIAQELNKFGEKINYSLITHLLPVFSGIYSTTIIHLDKELSQTTIDDLLKNDYWECDFVRIRNTPPELKWIIGSNYCDINAKSIGTKIIITAALDNLIKGAAGQAMQNMNKLFGWEETLGIKNYKEEFQNV